MTQSQMFVPSLIPGAYERNTLTYRQAGSMGGPAFGSMGITPGDNAMTAATVLDRQLEGGGGISQRPRPQVAPRVGDSDAATTATSNIGPSEKGVASWFRHSWRLAHSWFLAPAVIPKP